jgi:hypothetical protein
MIEKKNKTFTTIVNFKTIIYKYNMNMANEYLRIELDPNISEKFRWQISEIAKRSECDFVNGKLTT